MKRSLKLVPESLKELQEGIGDKYAERKWGIPDEERDWDKTYYKTQINKDKIIFSFEGVNIVKNPSSLKGFDPSVRGIILKNGDVYMTTSNTLIHNDLLKILHKKNIVKDSDYHLFHIKFPNEFITIQRYLSTNIIAVGESNVSLADSEQIWYRPIAGYKTEEVLKEFKKFLVAAKRKNPQFKYSYKIIDEIDSAPPLV